MLNIRKSFKNTWCFKDFSTAQVPLKECKQLKELLKHEGETTLLWMMYFQVCWCPMGGFLEVSWGGFGRLWGMLKASRSDSSAVVMLMFGFCPFVGRKVGWLNSGPLPPLGKKSHSDCPREKTTFGFARVGLPAWQYRQATWQSCLGLSTIACDCDCLEVYVGWLLIPTRRGVGEYV